MRTVGIVLAIVGLVIVLAAGAQAASRRGKADLRSLQETDFVLFMAGIALGATGLVLSMVGE